MCTSICDTFDAAGPHSSSGMWDFQVENSRHKWEERKRRSAETASVEGVIIIIIIPHSALL